MCARELATQSGAAMTASPIAVGRGSPLTGGDEASGRARRPGLTQPPLIDAKIVPRNNVAMTEQKKALDSLITRALNDPSFAAQLRERSLNGPQMSERADDFALFDGLPITPAELSGLRAPVLAKAKVPTLITLTTTSTTVMTSLSTMACTFTTLTTTTTTTSSTTTGGPEDPKPTREPRE